MAEGMKLATAYYELVPSMAGAQGDITRALGGPQYATAGKTAGGRFSSAFGGSIKGLATTLGGIFVAKKAFDFAKESVVSLQRIERISAQTDSAIAATGGAARVSTKHIEKLTGSLEAKTSTEAESVQEGANLLLTFKNVANAGKGQSAIFDRATTSAVDLSRAGFGSVQSASVLLGKALNDPIKGVSALGKSGVTFTQQQKDQIKTLVTSGKTLEAQKIILKEVEGQVGGAGKAFRQTTEGQLEQFQHQIGTLGEYLMSGLMPALANLTNWLLTKVVPAIASLQPYFLKAVGFIKSFFTGLRSGTDGGSSKLAQFRATVSTVFAAVKSIFTSAVSIIQSLWAAFGANIVQFARASFTNIMTVIRGAFTLIQGIFQTVSALLKGDWKGAWDGIKKILSGALSIIKGAISQAFNMLRFLFKNLGVALKGIFSGIWNGLKAMATAGLNGILSAIKGLPGKIKALGPLLKSAGKSLLDALLNGLKGGAGFVSEIAGKIWGAVKGMLNAAIDKINAALSFTIPIPGAPDISVNPPNIPHLADGGIVNRPTLALIGEAGPEAVVPLTGKNSPVGMGGASSEQIERLIQATEAARKFVIGQREFASAVSAANRTGGRL